MAEKQTSENQSANFLYEPNSQPTQIEKLFGETNHVKDEYKQHQIGYSFIFTVISVYLVQGARDSLSIAIFYYFQSQFDFGPSQLQQFWSYMLLPWTIKPLYGLIVDAFPICGYKRKPYILSFGILGSITMFIAIICADSYPIQAIFLVLNSVCVAICDVIADALTIERTEFKSHTVASRLQALGWGSKALISITTIIIGSNLIRSEKPNDILSVYWLYFSLTLLPPIAVIFLPEDKITNFERDQIAKNKEENDNTDKLNRQLSIKQIIRLSAETLCRKTIFYPMLFIFILKCTPTSIEPLKFYFVNILNFTPVQIGYLEIIASCGFLIAIGYIAFQSRRSNNTFSLRKQFLFWTIITAVLPFITLILIFGLNSKIGFPDYAFVISDRILLYASSNILFMCSLIFTARICPPGIEGFFMTILTSISNIAHTLSFQFSSAITSILRIECIEDEEDDNRVDCDFKYLWLLVIIVNLTTLIPLFLIKKVPNEEELQAINEEAKKISAGGSLRNVVNRGDMVGCYWFCMERICVCECCQEDETDNDEISKASKGENGNYGTLDTNTIEIGL